MPRGSGSGAGRERRREGNGPWRAIGTALGSIAPITFFGSAAIAIGLILYASLAPDSAAVVFEGANDWLVTEAGWFYMLAVGIFVLFLLGLAISPLGAVRLGPDESVPDYGYGTWVALLFSAGMGLGIVFYGIAEQSQLGRT